MHTLSWHWLVFLLLRSGCPSCLWRRAVVDHIAAVAASDNRRVCDCCRVADRTIWHPGRPDLIILVCLRLNQLLLLSIGQPVVGTGSPDNIGVVCYLFLLSCHACTLP